MSYRIGEGYIGSPSIQTTNKANYEVIPSGYKCYKFSFMNHNKPCTVKINNGNPIFIDIGTGFTMDHRDSIIWSFVIVEQNIEFNYLGAY